MRDRRFILTCILQIIVLLSATAALAGEYHFDTTLHCQECHIMHYSQSHQYGSGDPDLGTGNPSGYEQANLGGSGPYTHLLRESGNNLCLSCHDTRSFAPDVLGANTGTHARQAGGLTDSGSSGYDDWEGHTLDVAIHIAPGLPDCEDCHDTSDPVEMPANMPGLWLGCTDCHDPHGNIPSGTLDTKGNPVTSQFRNLRANGHITSLVGISYAKGTNDTNRDMFLGSWTKGSIATNYAVSNVDFNEPVADKSAMGQFCAVCHSLFHGTSTDGDMKSTGGWLRHPTADANISAISDFPYLPYSGIDYKVKVMDSDGDWANPDGDETPTCTTCHKSHGNNRPFGLIYAKGDNPLGEDGDGTQLRDLCKQCHVQGD